MIVYRNRFGQLDPGALTATVPEIPPSGQFSLAQYFFTAVAAGVTVWLITRMLDGKRR